MLYIVCQNPETTNTNILPTPSLPAEKGGELTITATPDTSFPDKKLISCTVLMPTKPKKEYLYAAMQSNGEQAHSITGPEKAVKFVR